jgi:hypothetical protein
MQVNIDDADVIPVGGGSLRQPAEPPVRQTVATFTPTRTQHPDELWTPMTRVTTATRGGFQGQPFGAYRVGHGLEDEPVTRNGRDSQHTVQAAHVVAASQVRAALRGGVAPI